MYSQKLDDMKLNAQQAQAYERIIQYDIDALLTGHQAGTPLLPEAARSWQLPTPHMLLEGSPDDSTQPTTTQLISQAQQGTNVYVSAPYDELIRICVETPLDQYSDEFKLPPPRRPWITADTLRLVEQRNAHTKHSTQWLEAHKRVKKSSRRDRVLHIDLRVKNGDWPDIGWVKRDQQAGQETPTFTMTSWKRRSGRPRTSPSCPYRLRNRHRSQTPR